MAAAMTLPEVREGVARLAGAFKSPLPPLAPGAQWQEAMTELAATVIRAADALLRQVHDSNAVTIEEKMQQEAIIDGFRQAAYLLMAQVNPDQVWVWTKEWQSRLREAEAAYAAGQFTRFEGDEAFLAALDAARPDSANP